MGNKQLKERVRQLESQANRDKLTPQGYRDLKEINKVLKHNYNSLENDYEDLQFKYQELLQSLRERMADKSVSQISPEAVEQYVDILLDNPDININGIPDNWEKSIYVNLLTMILSTIEKTLNETELKVLGHKLRLVITS
jgi:ElaB/YqjD/DUF883 family membrane-anchored ribosome-binding protein